MGSIELQDFDILRASMSNCEPCWSYVASRKVDEILSKWESYQHDIWTRL